MPALPAPELPSVDLEAKPKKRKRAKPEPDCAQPGVLLAAPKTEGKSHRVTLAHPLRHSDLLLSRLRISEARCQDLDARLELVAKSVCLTLGVKMDGEPAARPATKLLLQLLRLSRAYGLRYPRGLPRKEDEPLVFLKWETRTMQPDEVFAQCVDAGPRPRRLCTRRSWLVQACISLLCLLSCQEVFCLPGGATEAVLKWRHYILGSVHAAVQEALLNALHRLPFGKGIIREELPLYMDTLLEFHAELVALGEADEGSDLEVDKQNEKRVLNARYCLKRPKAKPQSGGKGRKPREPPANSSAAEAAEAMETTGDREG